MSALTPPRVRKSKTKADSETKRLSMRNLLWYCYSDQDEIDSSFFHLDSRDQFSRLASLDVVRYVTGYHDEHILDLEAQLDSLRGERMAMLASIDSLARVLRDVGVESESKTFSRAQVALRETADAISGEISQQRAASISDRTTVHALDRLKAQAQALSIRISTVDEAVSELLRTKDRDTRHLHEIRNTIDKVPSVLVRSRRTVRRCICIRVPVARSSSPKGPTIAASFADSRNSTTFQIRPKMPYYRRILDNDPTNFAK